jgi:hypothetical protein
MVDQIEILLAYLFDQIGCSYPQPKKAKNTIKAFTSTALMDDLTQFRSS